MRANKKHPPSPRPSAAPERSSDQANVIEALGLHPGQSLALLQELHILTREGRINQDSRRKLKQVQHLFHFIEPIVQELAQDGHAPIVADHGAGKSYLGFILYDLFFKDLGRGTLYGIEWREALVQRSRDLAQHLGFTRMHFLSMSVAQSVQQSDIPERFDLVSALHACDTATDDAIAFALHKQARAIVLVPCCQAEVAASLRHNKALQLARTPLAELWRHPLHTRELGSHLTNVLRCLYLEACGYHVSVTELVGWEHSMKNELIIARYHGQKKRSAAQRLQAIVTEFGLHELMGVRFPFMTPN